MSKKPISPPRRRMIEDMTVRNFVEKTHHDYIRHVRTFTVLGRSFPGHRALRRRRGPQGGCAEGRLDTTALAHSQHASDRDKQVCPRLGGGPPLEAEILKPRGWGRAK